MPWRQRVRRASRTLLAADFDGTLAPIVAEPTEAAPLPGVVGVLSELAARRDMRVAIVSGRALSDLEARCPAPGCWYIGGHGNENSSGGGGAGAAPARQKMRARLAAIAGELRQQLEEWRGARLEVKAYSLALHFRMAPAHAASMRAALSGYAGSGEFRVLEGRQVLELLPADALTKGHAVERMRHRLGCDLAVYFGDDTTDEDVFRLADTHIIGVKVESAENPGPSAADYTVRSPQEVLQALVEIARLRQEATGAAGAQDSAVGKKKLHNWAIQP
ncbi:MAG: trehalose-phosphatase [Terriglobales bacterium]